MAAGFLDDVSAWLGVRSLRELARLLGVSHAALSHLRTGRRRLSPELVVRIGRALKERSKTT